MGIARRPPRTKPRRLCGLHPPTRFPPEVKADQRHGVVGVRRFRSLRNRPDRTLLKPIERPISCPWAEKSSAIGTRTRSSEAPRVMQRRLGNGVVQRAIFSVLEAAGRPMRVAEVHRGVEESLEIPVSRGSINSCLSLGARECVRFERIAFGCYRPRPPPEITACGASRSGESLLRGTLAELDGARRARRPDSRARDRGV
jgi:hypothetical protein